MKRTIISVVAGLILLVVTYFLSNLIMNSGDEIVAKAVTAEENVKVTEVKNSTKNRIGKGPQNRAEINPKS